MSEWIEMPEVAPVVTQDQRLTVQRPTCGRRVTAPMPDAARGTPFEPRLQTVASYLMTVRTLSCEQR